MGRTHNPAADIVVLTPLPEEFEAVRRMLDDGKSLVDPTGKHTYWAGRIRTSSGAVLKVALRLTHKGHLATAEAVRQGVDTFLPKLLVLFGTAAGIRKVAMGDVVVATEGYSYESGKVTPEGFLVTPRAIPTTPAWVERANNLAGHSGWLAAWPEGSPPGVRFGPIISGEKVITDPDHEIVTRFKTHYQDAIALEMESYAFLHAARNYPQVATLIVRGISDFMAGKEIANGAGSKQQAVTNASAFLLALLREAADLAAPSRLSRYLAALALLVLVGLVGFFAIDSPASPVTPAQSALGMQEDTMSTASVAEENVTRNQVHKRVALPEPTLTEVALSPVATEPTDKPEQPSLDTSIVSEPPTPEVPAEKFVDVHIVVLKSTRQKWRQLEVLVDGKSRVRSRGNDLFNLPQGEHSLEIRSLGRTLIIDSVSISDQIGQSKQYINVD